MCLRFRRSYIHLTIYNDKNLYLNSREFLMVYYKNLSTIKRKQNYNWKCIDIERLGLPWWLKWRFYISKSFVEGLIFFWSTRSLACGLPGYTTSSLLVLRWSLSLSFFSGVSLTTSKPICGIEIFIGNSITPQSRWPQTLTRSVFGGYLTFSLMIVDRCWHDLSLLLCSPY